MFPGSTTVLPSKRALTEEQDGPSRLSASNIPGVPDFRRDQMRPHPPALPVKAKTDSGQYQHHYQRLPVSRKVGPPIHRGDPGEEYRAILKESQGGPVTLAHEIDTEHDVVTIWEGKCAPIGSRRKWDGLGHRASVVAMIVADGGGRDGKDGAGEDETGSVDLRGKVPNHS